MPKASPGLQHLATGLGRALRSVRRLVLSSFEAHDHGVTELSLEGCTVHVRPGPNEDYMVIDAGPVSDTDYDLEHWVEHDFTAREPCGAAVGARLVALDCYTDGFVDVALVLTFDSGAHFSLVLVDSDLRIAHELEPFHNAAEPVVPRLRERINAPPDLSGSAA